jgi:hypothetical protein
MATGERQLLSVPVSDPSNTAPAPNVWKLAVPWSPANWPVPSMNCILSSSKKGFPHEMLAAC